MWIFITHFANFSQNFAFFREKELIAQNNFLWRVFFAKFRILSSQKLSHLLVRENFACFRETDLKTKSFDFFPREQYAKKCEIFSLTCFCEIFAKRFALLLETLMARYNYAIIQLSGDGFAVFMYVPSNHYDFKCPRSCNAIIMSIVTKYMNSAII